MKLNLYSSKDRINKFQWLLLAKMLERGLSVKEGFELLESSYPDNLRIRAINKGLSNGVSLKKLLSNDSFSAELSFYADYLPLDKSIKLLIEQREKEKKLNRQIYSRLSYQFVLLLSSMMLLFLFTNYVLPNMMASIGTDNEKARTLLQVFTVLNIIKNLTLSSAALAGLFVIYIRSAKREAYLWSFLHRRKCDQAIKIFVTYRFSRKLKCMLQQGISFVEAVNVLRFKKDDRTLSMLAYHFDDSLQKGTEFEDSLDLDYFDNNFHSLCLYGLKGDDFIVSLEDYIVFTELKIEKFIKTACLFIQGFSYAFVAVIIVLAYQVILLPLELIGQF